MIACDSLRDRIPQVLAGHAGWSEGEARHLQECPRCRPEWDLARAVIVLGDAVVERVDPARIGLRVLQRLRRERHRSRARRVGWGAGLAAAAVFLLLLWPRPAARQNPETTGERSRPSEFILPVAGLDSLDSAALRTVLESLDRPLGGANSVGAPPLGDLDTQQLERVLRSLEG